MAGVIGHVANSASCTFETGTGQEASSNNTASDQAIPTGARVSADYRGAGSRPYPGVGWHENSVGAAERVLPRASTRLPHERLQQSYHENETDSSRCGFHDPPPVFSWILGIAASPSRGIPHIYECKQPSKSEWKECLLSAQLSCCFK